MTVVVALLLGAIAADEFGGAVDVNVAALAPPCAALALCLALSSVVPAARAGDPRRSVRRPKRIAVIGTQAAAAALEQELVLSANRAYVLLGWIDAGGGRRPQLPLPPSLGPISELRSLVERQRIDLLLIGPDVPRLRVFDELVGLIALPSVRVCELSAFYEESFGHIPVADINSAWFQYVLHPRFSTSTRGKRTFDIVAAAFLAIVTLPLMLVAMALIKLEDRGPVLYRQRRVGEKGRHFTMYKLRTMSVRRNGEGAQSWAAVDDPRITRVGRVLRALHLDELPQLYNILRGEMSVVGPRPEQTEIVPLLESRIAFYSQRHTIKPGLAGWAQLRCGYARSEHGSAWKLCHDLYYLKRRSLLLDLSILARTALLVISQIVTPRR